MKHIVPVFMLFLLACNGQPDYINRFGDEDLIAIYNLQDKRDSETLIPFLKAKKEDHRVAAALAFASTKDSIGIPFLSQMLQTDQKASCRKAAAYALGQIGDISALKALKPAFDAEMVPENQKTILEAIGKCGDSSTLSLFERVTYRDSILKLGWAYGVFRLALKNHTSPILTDRMFELLETSVSEQLLDVTSHYIYRVYRTDVGLAGDRIESIIDNLNYTHAEERLSLLVHVQQGLTESELQEMGLNFENLNTYKQALYISNAQANDSTLAWLSKLLFNDQYKKPTQNAAFEKYCSIAPDSKKWETVLMAIETGDMAFQSYATYEIRKVDKLVFAYDAKPVFNRISDALKNALSSLELPRKSETYIDIYKALQILKPLESAEIEAYEPSYNHPIDWDFVKSIPEKQQVVIETNKGSITLECHVNEAPGSVSNFLKLVDSGYYNGKYFHRVVPLFVIQAGCPRGDGWGSLAWSQRSEFSNYLNYTAGAVGLASAGNDTEGVQWFITHCPTPHLDGRYTIFADVIDGMDVVNAIEVGDEITMVYRQVTL